MPLNFKSYLETRNDFAIGSQPERRVKILISVTTTESAAIRSKDGGGGDCEANPRSQCWTATEEENRYNTAEEPLKQ